MSCAVGATPMILIFLVSMARIYAFRLSSARSDAFRTLSPIANAEVQRICGVAAFRSPDNNIRLPQRRLMIDNGENAKPGQFPWAASFAKGGSQNCGATLISSRHLVTAAHCVFHYSDLNLPCKGPTERKTSEIIVHLGGTCMSQNHNGGCEKKNTHEHKIAQFAYMEDFNKHQCLRGNDLAIVELTEDVQFDNSTLPVCLPLQQDSEHALNGYDNLNSAAYGRETQSSGMAAKLHYFLTAVWKYVSNDIFSAKATNRQGRICPGDSGGGLIGRDITTKRMTLIGVHSFAEDCGQPAWDKEYMNTMVGKHADKICRLTGVCRIDQ